MGTNDTEQDDTPARAWLERLLREGERASSESPYLTLRQASARSNYSVGHLRRLIYQKKLAAFRPAGGKAGRLLVRVEDLDALLCGTPAASA
jgi:hypothetical protein